MTHSFSQRVATVHKHVQSTPASTWTITHNLRDYPIIEAYSDDGLGTLTKIIPSSITYVDQVSCTVSFGSAMTGVVVAA